MKEIFVFIISLLLLIWLIFRQIERLKINHPNSELIVSLLNQVSSNSKASRSGRTNKKNRKNHHGKEKESAVHMCP
jgi:hypothetical protein